MPHRCGAPTLEAADLRHGACDASGRRPCDGWALWLLLGALLAASGWVEAVALEVRVEGLEGERRDNVLALLDIYREREEDLSEERLRALHRRAPEQIRTALAPFGLYRVEVSAALTEPTRPDGTWSAAYRVDPGEPVRIGRIDYRRTGPGAESGTIPKTFPMQVGDVLRHAEYERAKEQIRTATAQEGYLDAQVTLRRVLIDVAAYEAIIEYHLETGPQYFLGPVRFDQDLLEDRLLARYVTFDPGDPYNQDKLLELQARLLGTEYFDKVEIVPNKDEAGADRLVPIEVVATRNKANKFRFGLGFATDVGPRATLEWRRRYLNRWGHKVRTEIQISEPFQTLEADYRIPIGNPTRDYIIIRPELSAFDTASREGDLFVLQVAHSVVTPGGWRRTAGIDYRYEDSTVASLDAEQYNELVPNISWAKTVTDNPIYTTNGYRLKYTVQGAVEGLVSEASYLSGSVRFKWIKSFAEDYRLITRTDLGATWAESVFDLPASRRFFAGGDNSVRGWGLDVLGPRDRETNKAVGGRYLAVGSLELERRIKGDWSGAVFTDFGNAFDPDFENEVNVGAGLGLRWRSPIGQIRMDLAFALNKEQPAARLHLVIGPDL